MSIQEIILKLSLAVIIGGIVGYERGHHNSPAGFRTHILVCLATTIISLIQLQMVQTAIDIVTVNPELGSVINVDYARLGAQAITGMGFLGAGTIMHFKGAIRGLTTAASLWVVGTLGLAVGMGYYEISIIGIIFIYLVLVILKKVQTRYISRVSEFNVTIVFRSIANIDKLVDYIDCIYLGNGIKVVEVEKIKDNERDAVIHKLMIPSSVDSNELRNQILMHTGVKKIKVEQIR